MRAVSDSQPVKKKVMSLAELEQELITGRKPASSKALPARSVSPEIGSPPVVIPLPIGTPPRGSMMHHARLPHHPAEQQKHQQFPQHIQATPQATPPPIQQKVNLEGMRHVSFFLCYFIYLSLFKTCLSLSCYQIVWELTCTNMYKYFHKVHSLVFYVVYTFP